MKILKLKTISIRFLSLLEIIAKKFEVDLYYLLRKFTKDCNTFLDLGCGSNSPIRCIKKNGDYALGVDVNENYIKISKKKRIHDDYLVSNILEIDKKVESKSFDCVLLLDVIEHLDKRDGIEIIKKIERIAKKRIIIFTPNGFLIQREHHQNLYQKHRSGWSMTIFKKLDFNIYGIRGLKWLRGEFASLKYQPFIFWNKISRISDSFVKKYPQFAFQLLCIKDIKK